MSGLKKSYYVGGWSQLRGLRIYTQKGSKNLQIGEVSDAERERERERELRSRGTKGERAETGDVKWAIWM